MRLVAIDPRRSGENYQGWRVHRAAADGVTRGRTRVGRHPRRTAPRPGHDDDHIAGQCRNGLRGLDARVASVIRLEAVWLASEPLDKRGGTESTLARVVQVFSGARPHHAYLFADRQTNRMKVLAPDGIGAWLAVRRLNSGRFV